MTSLTSPTPVERLANSRKAIVRHMSRDQLAHDEEAGAGESEAEDPANFGDGGTWGILKHVVGSWWQHHPVSIAFHLARPAIGKYAEEKPLQLLGLAAAAGAAAVVLKPWRLVSLGGVLVAALKSSELSGALFSMLSSTPQRPEQTSQTK
ncbi:hypothetical protein [Polaromonas aquatica]|uniref:hypothetical protein n=1 Tax=Polaromonas aquatica TaxID=332657 RepID=UPI003D649968